MNRMLVGAFATLVLVAIGLFWWQGRAVEAVGAPLPEPQAAPERKVPEALPSADVGSLRGPELPTAAKMSDELRRFSRFDINRDMMVTRNEMLSTRVAAFRKLDKDGNNLLTFEEWAVTTVNRFDGADADRDGRLTPAEFRTTAPKPAPRKSCSC